MTLEQKLMRLQAIQKTLEEGKVSLSDSLPLLEEALKLKQEIESELKTIENRLTKLSVTEDHQKDADED